MALTPERVRAYRADYRERIPSNYNGWRHLAITSGLCIAAIVAALWFIERLEWVELLAVPTAWVLANLLEYVVHRWPMHHATAGMSRLYKRHTSQHHRFFSERMMAVDDPTDFHVTLFPAWIVLFFLGLLGAPVALLAAWLFSADVGLLVYAAVVFYYLMYEWAHLGSHMPKDSWIGRLPGVAYARAHHGAHHDPAKMRRLNFNFAVPLGDWLFRTKD